MKYLERVISGINKRKDENSKGNILKPFPSEHSCRMKDPADFEKGSFRRKNIDNGVDLILGRLKEETTMTKQAYRFKKDVYTQAEAKEWLKRNKITCIRFEPAAKSLEETFFENLKL